MGISGETRIKFDIKREGKEHLASREYTIKSLFSGKKKVLRSLEYTDSHLSSGL